MLIQKDIEKKKSALEEEKSLIDERLQKRRESEDEARRYEELAEYQRQYAQISMDPTRTKDAVEMLKKISDLQKELAWDTAEDEAKAIQESIDDQIKGYEDYQTVGDEDLQMLLDDANNFTVEVNDILKMSFDDMMTWLSTNVEEYSKSLLESQQTFLDQWEDTFRQMKGITGQGFEEMFGLALTYGIVPDVLSSKESFLEYMMGTDDFINALSDEERFQMIYGWEEMYDNYIAALKTGADYRHDDDWLSLGGKASSGSGSGSGSKTNSDTDESEGTHGYSFSAFGNSYSNEGYKSIADAQDAALKNLNSTAAAYAYRNHQNYGAPIEQETDKFKTAAHQTLKVYESGGIVDYTGPAWVDGTYAKPEAFLNADDTALLRSMLDAATRCIRSPYISTFGDSDFERGSNSFGDITVNINEAEISDDRDIEEVAEKVGEAIVKTISKTGFNTGNFSF